MSSPSAIIDSDLPLWSNDIQFILETSAIWKTSNLTVAGAATWTKVYDAAIEFSGGTFGAFVRVRCSATKDLIYVIGWAENDLTDDTQPFCMKSIDCGVTWMLFWVDQELTERDYTVTHTAKSYTWNVGQADFETTKTDHTHTRIGDSESTYNPWAYAYKGVYSCTSAVYIGVRQIADGIIDFYRSPDDCSTIQGEGNDLLGDSGNAGKAYLNDYFGVGNWTEDPGLNHYMPKEPGRKYLQFLVDIQSYDPQPAGSLIIDTWVFWNKPSVIEPIAFDVARTNSQWLYLGLANKILKSEDGGETWTVLTAIDGANDIYVDPLIAGAIYFWATNGHFHLMTNGVLTPAGALDTETPLQIPLRIAKSLNSGKVWVLKSGVSLRKYESAAWTDQKTGLSGARGLHVCLGDIMIFAGNANIYYSADAGVTVSNKKGTWATYANPINSQLMVQ